MGKEEWRDIPEYEGSYQVSNHGRVKSLDRYTQCRDRTRLVKGKILKLWKDLEGYYTVSLCKMSAIKAYKVHRLVLTAFDRPPKKGEQCNHKDGIKGSNIPENLEWVSHIQNCNHRDNILGKHTRGEKNPGHKLSEQDVREIRVYIKEGKLTQAQIAVMFKVNKSAISNIKYGITWKHKGYECGCGTKRGSLCKRKKN